MSGRRMFRPDDEDKPFIARWNMLTRILLVESSVKLVARAAMDFADFDDGSSCFPSNDRIARETGFSDKTVRTAWAALRGMGMAYRAGRAVSYRRLADEYQLQIPEHWEGLPVLGPHIRAFTCLGCGKAFNPQGNCTVNSQPGDQPGADAVRFDLGRMVFCPAPRKTAGRSVDACKTVWSKERIDAGEQPWNQLGQERWELFRQARGDDW